MDPMQEDTANKVDVVAAAESTAENGSDDNTSEKNSVVNNNGTHKRGKGRGKALKKANLKTLFKCTNSLKVLKLYRYLTDIRYFGKKVI